MYPKVFLAFAAAQSTYGPVSKLPTPVCFYRLGDLPCIRLWKLRHSLDD
jgi:pyruvate carboxylase